MNESPVDHDERKKVQRVFGRGMLEGARLAGIPNPKEFLMSQKTLRSAVAGLNGVATKVLGAVPLAEDWTVHQIGAELKRQGFAYELDVVEGTLAQLQEIGAIKVLGMGKGRTYRSQYNTAVRPPVHLVQDTSVIIGDPPLPKTTPATTTTITPTNVPISDPLSFLASLAADVRILSGTLSTLADRLDDTALAVVAEIDKAGSAGDELRKTKALLRELLKED